MKKLLLLGWLTVLGLSLAPAPAHAWWLHNCCCCSHHYSMKICVTPYNAFSPVCAGNFCCVGCNPFCCGPQQPPAPPPCAYGQDGPPLCNSNCCESGCLPSTVPAPGSGGKDGGKDGGNGSSGGTSFAPPVVPQAPVAQGYPAPMPYGLVRPANNYPQGYYPSFNNTVANPYQAAPTMPVPNFNYQSNYNPYPYGMNPYANMNPYGNMNPNGGMNPYGR